MLHLKPRLARGPIPATKQSLDLWKTVTLQFGRDPLPFFELSNPKHTFGDLCFSRKQWQQLAARYGLATRRNTNHHLNARECEQSLGNDWAKVTEGAAHSFCAGAGRIRQEFV